MRQSELFVKTSKQAPADATSINHQLLVRAGFVDQLMAGAYSYLPLGLRVLRKIENIVREEMDKIGGQEVLMPILHPAEIWKTTGGWDKIDILFKIKSRTDNEYALGQSEEEVVTPLAMKFIQSYKDLPIFPYQIHWKYRDELRAKSGLLRGREFLMKDMYSFHTSQEDFERYYAIVKKAYLKIYDRLGLVAKVTEASGGAFSEKISYEFEVLTPAGEDVIFYCEECDFCVNSEIATVKVGDKCPSCNKGVLKEAKASEVGNVFDLGQKFPKAFDLTYVDSSDKPQFPFMGCYGLGISRVMGVIVEKFNDEKGIVWPESVAPFDIHLISLGVDEKVKKTVQELYEKLTKEGREVLFDDRDEGAGTKLSDSDLIGIPQRYIVSEKTMAEESIEVKKRSEEATKLVKLSSL